MTPYTFRRFLREDFAPCALMACILLLVLFA